VPEATKDAARSIPGAARRSFIDSHFTGIILIIGVLLRILSSFLSANNGGDAWAREGITATWLSHPSLKLNFDAWLPFHFWLMGGLAAILGDNVRLAGRLLSFLAGTASLFVFYKVVRTLYNESAAQIGLTAFVLYSLGIAYSSTSSSEAVYLLFVLLGLLGYFRYRQYCSLSDLAFSGVFFSYERFPAMIQPLIKALPLTALNDALRASILEGRPLSHQWPRLLVLTLWGGISFVLAVRWFRWT